MIMQFMELAIYRTVEDDPPHRVVYEVIVDGQVKNSWHDPRLAQDELLQELRKKLGE